MTDFENKRVLEYAAPGPLPRWASRFTKPVGWFLTTAAILAALMLCYAHSVPAFYFGALLLGAFSCFGVVGTWIIRFFIRLVLVLIARDPTLRVWAQWWRWLYVPVVLALTYFALTFDAPLKVCFLISRPAMDRLAHEVATTPGPYADRRVGWYTATRIEAIPGGVRFEIPSAGFLSKGGFAKSPVPPTVSTWRYRHYSGDWYTAIETF
jgi:hypothetical protein